VGTLKIAPRFCGPPGTANGGYCAGLLAQTLAAPGMAVRVRLKAPIPLGTELAVTPLADDGHALSLGDQVLATALPSVLQLQLPPALDAAAAARAAGRFIAFGRHAFPGCFVCGDARGAGDGLRIFAGASDDGSVVAAPWTPDATLANHAGWLTPEFIWAALDCPGYFAARSDRVPMLLGEFTARVDAPVRIGEPCVLLGWRIAVDGRKYSVGTALFNAAGQCCGQAAALWLEPRPLPQSGSAAEPHAAR
jgi:hypothetical protein